MLAGVWLRRVADTVVWAGGLSSAVSGTLREPATWLGDGVRHLQNNGPAAGLHPAYSDASRFPRVKPRSGAGMSRPTASTLNNSPISASLSSFCTGATTCA